LNSVALNVSLPCLAFHQLHALGSFESLSSALLPALMPWIVFLGSLVFFGVIARARGWPRSVLGALLLAAGFGNTSFVGFPLLIALRGEGSLRFGVIADQFGSFLGISTVGLFVAALLADKKPSPTGIMLRVLRFPPFIAAVLGLVSRNTPIPGAILAPLAWIGSTLTPFALLSVGIDLGILKREGKLNVRGFAGPMAAGLAFKLVIAPVAIAILYLGAFGARGEVAGVSVLEAAMAPMVTGAVIAREEGLAPELASLLIGVGIPLSLVTVPCWDWVLRRLGA
jgi:predicted permease